MRFFPAVILIISSVLFSSDPYGDILKNYSGKQKYENMLTIADSIFTENDSLSRNYVDQTVDFAQKNNEPILLMKARYVYGDILYHSGSYRKAAEEYKNSLIIAEKEKDYNYLYENCKQLGGVFYYLSDYKTATIFLYKASDLAKSLGDELKEADICNELGVVYDEIKDYGKALEYYDLALGVFQKNNKLKEIARTYNNIATTQFNKQEYDTALKTFEKALNIYSAEKEESRVAIILNNMASIEIEVKRYNKALEYLKKSNKIFTAESDVYGLALNDHNFGKAYYHKKNYKLAVTYLDESLRSAVEMEVPTLVRDNYLYKSKVDSARGDFRASYKNLLSFLKVSEKVASDTKQREIQEITAKYELAQKEKQNSSLIRDNEIKRLQLDKQRQINNFFIILFVLIAGISYLAYRSYILKSKNEQLLKNYSEEIERLNLRLSEEIEKTKDELNESNEKLRKTEKEAARMDKLVSLGTMVAGITHEIKNPTQVIKLSMDNIRMCLNDLAVFIYELIKLNKNKKAGVSEIKDLIEKHRLTKLFNDIKSLLISNKKSVELIDQIVSSTTKITHFNRETRENLINDIINDVLIIIKNSLKYSAKIELELDTNLPPLKCNYQEMAQILINLLTNARDAINSRNLDHGEGLIRIKSGFESGKMFIEVSDNGSGMSEDQREKAFEAFYTTKETGEGQGLGLSIVKSIVDIYGGFITVDSKIGEGTTFRINFPVEDIAKKQDELTIGDTQNV